MTIDNFNRHYLLGGSLGLLFGSLVGVAVLPLFSGVWWLCVIGVFTMAWTGQGAWNLYHKKRESDGEGK